MIITSNTILDTLGKKEMLIDAFEDISPIERKIDKFGFEYIDCADIDPKYDKETTFVADAVVRLTDHIKLYEPTKSGLKLKYAQIRKQYDTMEKPWSNERAWNRLDIHIPINKTTGGNYNFNGNVVRPIAGNILMFDPLRDWWSVDKVQHPQYKIIFRFSDEDPNLQYSGREEPEV